LGIGDWGLGIGDWAQSPIPMMIMNKIIINYISIIKYIINFYDNNYKKKN
jgi:hypothetical protein